MASDDTTIKEFFAQYGRALAAGDLPGISGSYEEPAFLLSDRGGRPLTRASIEADYDGAAEEHQAGGLVGAVPTIVASEELSPTLVSVDVHWAYVDAGGDALAQDGYRYILRVGPDTAPQIVTVVVTPDRLRR